MTGPSRTNASPTDPVQIDPDGLTCVVCDQPGEVATPAGKVCREHAEQLEEHYEGER